MKERTDAEIGEFVKNTIGDNGWAEAPDVRVHRFGDRIELSIYAMYERPKLRFEDVNKLAEFFDTMNIETGSEFDSGGCESCDWGSEYGFELYVSPGDPYTEVGQNG